MIIVWGSIEAKPEHIDEVLKLSLEHVQRSRKEPGCISHSVQLDAENPHRLVFYEQWQDQAALHAHFAVPASGVFVERVAGLATAPPAIELYEATKIN